jgi:hypothetical protein
MAMWRLPQKRVSIPAHGRAPAQRNLLVLADLGVAHPHGALCAVNVAPFERKQAALARRPPSAKSNSGSTHGLQLAVSSDGRRASLSVVKTTKRTTLLSARCAWRAAHSTSNASCSLRSGSPQSFSGPKTLQEVTAWSGTPDFL